MGMSASQARLIQLTARMSDVEYEGQQINQQRLTLSNKMNEVYEQSINMEVPTPPSKIDYPLNRFVGKTSEGKDVKLTVNSDGTTRVTSAQTAMYITPSSKSAGKIVDERYRAVTSSEVEKAFPYDDYDHTKYKPAYEATKIVTNEEELNNYADDALYTVTPQGENQWEVKMNTPVGYLTPPSGQDKNGFTYTRKENTFVDDNGQTYTDEQRIPKDRWSEATQEKIKEKYVDLSTNSPSHDFGFENGKLGETQTIYIQDKNGDKVIKSKQLDSDFKYINLNDEKDTSVDKGSVAYKKAYEGLKNYVEANDRNAYEPIDDYIKNNYSVKTNIASDGTVSYSYVKNSELENLTADSVVTVLNPAQMVDAQVKDSGATITYGADGEMIAELSGGEKVSLFQDNDGYDEVAYDAAYVEYEREKIAYDKAQNELNKKTSMYQRQDKQLELKLTRLDNERNALNTEIESVKKVIQDATERGFKTFSG